MNNMLSLLEILVVVSATLQVGTIFIFMFLCTKFSKEERKVWIWFFFPLVLILVRRMLAGFRYSLSWSTLETEYVITIVVSLCWIMFLYKFIANKIKEEKTDEQKNRRSPSCHSEQGD